MQIASIGTIYKGKSYSSVVYHLPCDILLDNGETHIFTITKSKLRDIKVTLSRLYVGYIITGLVFQKDYWIYTPFCNLY